MLYNVERAANGQQKMGVNAKRQGVEFIHDEDTRNPAAIYIIISRPIQ